MNPFIERHQEKITGVLSCFDRVVITGTLPDIGHADVLARFLSYHGIKLFDYPRWAEPLRDELHQHAERLAVEAGLEIEFIRRHKAFRKEDRIPAILAQRGDHPGLVHIFSAMGACSAFRPWYDKQTQHPVLKPTAGKCLHYYFYFIDAAFGLCYVRVPTWAPYRLQVYFNGHHWLARRLEKAGIAFHMADNAFLSIADPNQAQRLAERCQTPAPPAQSLGATVLPNSPALPLRLPLERHAGGIRHRCRLPETGRVSTLYEAIIRTAVNAIRADNVVTFLGRKLTQAYQDEVGNNFSTRIQGTRLRHQMGPASIKLYEKAGIIARIECTTNDVSFLKLNRWVEKRDGWQQWKLAPLRKHIYSLPDLRQLIQAANERYLAFMAAIDSPDAGLKDIDKMSSPAREQGRACRGFNLFQHQDYRLFLTLARGEWSISGFRAADLRAHMPPLSPSQSSYLLKRLRTMA
jgi:hypothetical protein